MNNNQSRWLGILKSSDALDLDPIINEGSLENVELLNSNLTWHLYLRFSKVVSADLIFTMMNKVQKYLLSVAKIEQIMFSFRYDDSHCNKELVEEYLDKFINILSTRNHALKSLNRYSKNVNDDSIVYLVASSADQALVLENLKIVKPLFNTFGLKTINIDVLVNDTEIDFETVKKRQMEIQEEQADTRSYEKLVNIVEASKLEQNRVELKQKRNSAALKMKIEELPSTSMAVQEFRQKNSTDQIISEGTLISKEIRKAGNYLIFIGILTNYRDSIVIKHFIKDNEKKFFEEVLQINSNILVKGSLQYDTFANDVVVMAYEITVMGKADLQERVDEAINKRVELHAHSKMSVLDSVMDVQKYVDMASHFHHKALAISDHANCHILPDFFEACKKAKIKAIAGVEGYYIDDTSYKIALTDDDIKLSDATFVVFDLETTGFSINYNEIIEIGAVKIYKGMPVDSFISFVKPKEIISKVITELTNITNEDVYDAEGIEQVLPRFLEFIKGSILVAHNATFDTEFLYENMRRLGLFNGPLPCIDTLQLARSFYSNILKRFNLKDVAKGLKVEVETQHRALSDAQTTTNIFMKMLGDLYDHQVTNYNQINGLIDQNDIYKYIIPRHINILVKTHKGLKNFYKLISDSNTIHFHKEARVLKSVIEKYRDGLLIGSGCSNGELFRLAYEGNFERFKEKLAFYDYVEVQPLDCYSDIVEASGNPLTLEHIKETIKKMVEACDALGKIVVATGDVHQLNPEDVKYRKIFTRVSRPGGGMHDLFKIDNLPNCYFRSTQEMLDAFNFLPTNVAYDLVVTNTNKIADMCEEYELFPDKLFTPRDDFMAKYGVPSMKDALREKCYQKAHAIYGDELPKYVANRLQTELNSIIGNGFSSVYYISSMLVKNSNDHGYIVGSRGSVGSSFVATMMDITEVNPLRAHYVCPNCHFSAFKGIDEENMPDDLRANLDTTNVGFDLPDAVCPHCGSPLHKDGVDIPFETFLGFKGEKVPDIDLNFSGEYQPRAHLFTQEVFGVDNAFRAGTIGTVAEKTAYGYVKNYYEEKGESIREAEVRRIANALIDAKRTTGQHPGGIVIVPDYMEYADIIPVQYAADDLTLDIRTTHFEYHKFEKNLLKLDILGHDDPTVLKNLMDFVHYNPDEFPFDSIDDIPFYDPKIISLFSSKEALNLKGDDNDDLKSGTIGIPEFGTDFVRGMLNDIMPKKVEDIIKVSGISHGTDVWLGNARDLLFGLSMTKEPIPFDKVIGCRDDIMVDLINYGLDDSDAFSIMEHVRKGKGLTTAEKALMSAHDVPEWYQLSCERIKYMFPKAHATAYVIQALRIGWFKVYAPIYYYAAYFSCRAKEFDVDVLASGKNAIRNKITEIKQKKASKTNTNKEDDLLAELQIALEMYLRGYSFRQVNIEKSEASTFVIAEDKKSLYLPFTAVDKLGAAAAQSVVDARLDHPFTSKKDLDRRTKLNKSIYNTLLRLGALDSLPDEDNNALF